MKVLIFGNSGFIGKNIEQFLINHEIEVFGISNSDGNSDLCLDICDHHAFNSIKFTPDIVINCASILPENDALRNSSYIEKVFKVNVLGAVNIANWAKAKSVKKLFNLSTLVVTKKPWKIDLKETDFELPEGNHIAYCMSKISQERIMTEILSNTSTKLTNLRLAAVYGDMMKPEGILFSIFNKAINNAKIDLINGDTTSFNFIHVHDVTKIIYALLETEFYYDILNLASFEEIKLIDLAYLIKGIVLSSSEISNIESERLPSYSNVNIDRLLTIINGKFKFIPLNDGLTKLFHNEIPNFG
jgi:nucleoside-diphosphate-sugar epimerase